jgi:hypothetical protein
VKQTNNPERSRALLEDEEDQKMLKFHRIIENKWTRTAKEISDKTE